MNDCSLHFLTLFTYPIALQFPVESYEAELEGMRGKAPEEVVCELRRCSVGFAR